MSVLEQVLRIRGSSGVGDVAQGEVGTIPNPKWSWFEVATTLYIVSVQPSCGNEGFGWVQSQGCSYDSEIITKVRMD